MVPTRVVSTPRRKKATADSRDDREYSVAPRDPQLDFDRGSLGCAAVLLVAAVSQANLTPTQLIYRRGVWREGLGTSVLVARFRYVRCSDGPDRWYIWDRGMQKRLSPDEAASITLKQALEAAP